MDDFKITMTFIILHFIIQDGVKIFKHRAVVQNYTRDLAVDLFWETLTKYKDEPYELVVYGPFLEDAVPFYYRSERE